MNLNLTLFGQSITFIVFIWFCARFIWPLIIQAMRERQKTIADGLASAERADKDLELARERVAEELRHAKTEAQGIIDQARHQASQMVDEAKNDARVEGERITEAAQGEIEQEVNRAKEGLRVDVAALAVAGAERILASSIDRTQHAALLEKLAAEL